MTDEQRSMLEYVQDMKADGWFAHWSEQRKGTHSEAVSKM